MKKDEITRNRTAVKENKEDPAIRDRSGIQPGTSTVSSSKTDEENEQLTRTTADNNESTEKDPNADKVFDE